MVLTRRRFLLSSAAAIAAVTAPRSIKPVLAADAPTTLRAESRILEVHGKAAKVFGISQPTGLTA